AHAAAAQLLQNAVAGDRPGDFLGRYRGGSRRLKRLRVGEPFRVMPGEVVGGGPVAELVPQAELFLQQEANVLGVLPEDGEAAQVLLDAGRVVDGRRRGVVAAEEEF